MAIARLMAKPSFSGISLRAVGLNHNRRRVHMTIHAPARNETGRRLAAFDGRPVLAYP